MTRWSKPILAAAVVAWWVGSAVAEVKLPAVFSDDMVLQREMSVPVWGWADDGEKVTVRFAGQQVSTTANDGKWMVRLAPLATGAPSRMTVSGKNKIELENVLVGEVWICSGQSNMAWTVDRSDNASTEIADSANAKIRLFTVSRRGTDDPQSDVPRTETNGRWLECGPKTIAKFSAVGYFFGRDLQEALDVPIGLINTSYGGTPAEAWTRRGALKSAPSLRGIVEAQDERVRKFDPVKAKKAFEGKLAQWKLKAAEAKKAGKRGPRKPRFADPRANPRRPAALYNAMIAPLIPYAVRGAIWYQGESNSGAAHQYHTLFPAMIANWRADWKQGDFPFLFVQLAPFRKITTEPTESAWAELREAQRLTTHKLPNTGMAVITDVGEENDIHPKRKQPVGARLALAARKLAYGADIVHSGPEFERMTVDGDEAILEFKHVGHGLVAKDGPLTGFTICGSDHTWVNANAKIVGDRIVVSSPQVDKPVAVRFGWANYPVLNLWNKDGLPATPFRTDEFRLTTQRGG